MALDLLMTVKSGDPKIEGESQHKKFEGKKAIDIRSWAYAVNQPSQMGSAGKTTGRANFSDISITKPIDASTPALFLACAAGSVLDEVVIHAVKTGGVGGTDIFYTITMQSVVISQVKDESVIDEEGGVVEILESVTFNPARVKVGYAPTHKDSGKIEAEKTAGWDIIKNVKV
ncbi:Hcp family type VI secretion system effector [Sphingomonas sp.]|uniref:Hcp family type VI secretion system effector n=1 Tax=Sphingomonas sp. TaxID=28214 RepID=UPI002DD62B12|nr:type VI secretion system tube protein Hcp [Sphingomonas sp.]